MRGNVENRIYTKHEKEDGKLLMGGGSWTINLKEVNIVDIDKFVYDTELARYSISSEDVLKHGWHKTFAGEPKMVVALKHWNKELHNER